MGDIKHTGIAAHAMVFIKLRTVVDGHVPTGKIDQSGTGGPVSFV
jgi:hypothetical protein